MTTPSLGDSVLMPFMGADVAIKVGSVPAEQPHAEEGVHAIVDQYGETHQVELDGDDWVTVVHAL